LIKIENIFDPKEGGEESAKTESDSRDNQTEDTFGDTFARGRDFSFVTFGGNVLVSGNDDLKNKINKGDSGEDADDITDEFFGDGGTISAWVDKTSVRDLISQEMIS
jgi:hypothetical protein